MPKSIFNLDFEQAEIVVASLLCGMARAEDRFRANLRTVDQHGNLLEDSRRIDKDNEA